MKENVVSPKTQPETAPGKVVPALASGGLQKLAAALATCTAALAAAEGEQRAAEQILAEAAPVCFDHAAAGRSIAEARVSDMLNGGTTAEGVQQRLDRERSAAESAAAAFAKRQADAHAQAERAGPMIAALRAQALELDRVVRQELARRGRELQAVAESALAGAIAAYLAAYVEYRAVRWLAGAGAENIREHGRQFWQPEEADISITCPEDLLDSLPAGWAPTTPRGLAKLGRYELARLIGDRRSALMEAATGGAYPKAGADLHTRGTLTMR